MRSAECGVRSAECGVWSAECGAVPGVRNADRTRPPCSSHACGGYGGRKGVGDAFVKAAQSYQGAQGAPGNAGQRRATQGS